MTPKQSSLFPDFDTSDKLYVLRGLYRAEVEPLAFEIISSNPADPTTRRTGAAGARIFRTLRALKKDGQSEDTLRAKGDRLRFLAKHARGSRNGLVPGDKRSSSARVNLLDFLYVFSPPPMSPLAPLTANARARSIY